VLKFLIPPVVSLPRFAQALQLLIPLLCFIILTVLFALRFVFQSHASDMLPETVPQPPSDAYHPSDQTTGLHSGVELAYRPANDAVYSHHGNDEEMGDADVDHDTEDAVMDDGSNKEDDAEEDDGDDEAMDDESNEDDDSEEDDGDSKKDVWPREALVAYGSETGTALDFAEEIVDLLRRHEFETKLAELDAGDPVSGRGI
jgi:hypothetical protein